MKWRSSKSPRTRIMFLETSDMSIEYHLDGLSGFIANSLNAEICLVSADSGRLAAVANRNQVDWWPLSMERNPSLMTDLRALTSLVAFIVRWRPDVVVYGTPKAALLGALASTLAAVPHRVFVVHGLRVETLTGLGRVLMRCADRLIEAFSTDTVAVGHSLAQRAVAGGSLRRRPKVLGKGSAQGIDLTRFYPPSPSEPAPKHRHRRLKIGFAGRLTADKGLDLLVESFMRTKDAFPGAELHLAGTPEGLETLAESTRCALRSRGDIVLHGDVQDVGSFMRSIDVFAFPTLREGLPTVLLEASACAVPIVATRATGVQDVIEDGVTGHLVDVGHVDDFTEKVNQVLSEPESAKAMAMRARAHAEESFSHEAVWGHWRAYLESVVRKGAA